MFVQIINLEVKIMQRMFERFDKIGPARKKQITRHEHSELKEDVGLPEDIRVINGEESTPHDGDRTRNS
jgi:hypothetical protein